MSLQKLKCESKEEERILSLILWSSRQLHTDKQRNMTANLINIGKVFFVLYKAKDFTKYLDIIIDGNYV